MNNGIFWVQYGMVQDFFHQLYQSVNVPSDAQMIFTLFTRQPVHFEQGCMSYFQMIWTHKPMN